MPTDTMSGGKLPMALILRLAAKDLKHEWILSLCLVMAVAAVLGPILILLGLKFGSIQILRNRLVDDPRNREIRPMISTRFEHTWFSKISGRKDVAFIVPMTRQISTSISACVREKDSGTCRAEIELDLLPTAGGDPLLLDNGSDVPDPGGCVLTSRAAEEAQAKQGDTLEVTVKRIMDGAYQKVQLQLIVKGILDERAGSTRSLFVNLPVLEAVESYKDGGAVPEYGWPGRTLHAYAQYDGLVLWVSEPLSQLNQVMLKNNTGFSHLESLNAEQLQEKTGFRINRHGTINLLSTLKKAAGEESVEIIRNRLRGKTFRLIPWVKPMEAIATDSTGQQLHISLISLGYDQAIARELDITPIPPWPELQQDIQSSWLHGMTTADGQPQGSARLEVQRGENTMTLPLQITGHLEPGGQLYIPFQLGSILRLLEDRQVEYDTERGIFVLNRQGYAGFRLYAATIDEVEGLRRHFEEAGLPVATQADRIRDVQELNRYLTLIFWVIAIAAAAGGIATLAASLYASVERKRRDIGVLRLLGLSRLLLFRFPIYQGMLLSLGGLLVAFTFFFSLATLINSLFGVMMRQGEHLCTLAWQHLAWIALTIFVIAILAATGAAWRVTRLEPVEALRDE